MIKSRFARFLLAGFINTIFGFTVYSLLVIIGLPIWVSLLSANATGVVFNFVTTGYYAFKSLILAYFPRFFMAYAIIYLLNWFFIGILMRFGLTPIYAQAVLTPAMTISSYFMMANYVFASRGKK